MVSRYDSRKPRGEQIALFVPASDLKKIAEKIVKGLAFIEDGHLIDTNAEIEHHVVSKEDAGPIEDILVRFGKVHSRGPGIEVARAVTQDDGISAFYKITIWGEFVMYVSVIRVNNQLESSDSPQML